jgi:hypothetical protein
MNGEHPMTDVTPRTVDDVLTRENSRARWHDEPNDHGWEAWACVPITEVRYTLDAERAARVPAPADGLDPAPLSPVLRRAVIELQAERDAMRAALDECRKHHADTVAGLDPHTGVPAPADGLDVERLARAYAKESDDNFMRTFAAEPDEFVHADWHDYMDRARDTAAAYAALGEAP